MTRLSLIAAAAVAVTAGAATAQTTTTTQQVVPSDLPPTMVLLRQACQASALERFGTPDATIAGEQEIAGGLKLTMNIPGRDDPWVCDVVVGDAYGSGGAAAVDMEADAETNMEAGAGMDQDTADSTALETPLNSEVDPDMDGELEGGTN